MYNYVYEYQFLPLKLDEAPIELQEMVETYYKGKQEQWARICGKIVQSDIRYLPEQLNELKNKELYAESMYSCYQNYERFAVFIGCLVYQWTGHHKTCVFRQFQPCG